MTPFLWLSCPKIKFKIIILIKIVEIIKIRFCHNRMKNIVFGEYEIVKNFMYALEKNDLIILPLNLASLYLRITFEIISAMKAFYSEDVLCRKIFYFFKKYTF